MISPNSLIFVQLLSQVRVRLLPQVGDGQAMWQEPEPRYLGELQLEQAAAVPEQVAQVLPQTLHILLSEVSPNSFVFEQEVPHVRVLLLPQVGVGHPRTQVDTLKYFGDPQLVQEVAVVAHVKQFGSHVLHILLSAGSPYSFPLAQEESHVLVALFPHFGEGH